MVDAESLEDPRREIRTIKTMTVLNRHARAAERAATGTALHSPPDGRRRLRARVAASEHVSV